MNLSTHPVAGLRNPARRFLTWRGLALILYGSAQSRPGFARLGKALGWLAAAILALGTPAFAQDPPAGFGLEQVTVRAKALADAPYVAPASNLPDAFSRMQFSDYQKIQPRRDRFTWAGLDTPFKLAFYHQGMQFNTPVKISEIVDGAAQEIRYAPDRFDFGDLHFDRDQTSKLGWAGFRVLYPINQPGKEDEIMSLLGASYFRVIGKGQIYGLSGRGLAIDTGLSAPEEFPVFREYWIRRPAPQDRYLTFYALLDAPHATGAYEFTLTPGADTMLGVKARVFLRSGGAPAVLGVAPLTSMFLYGPTQPLPVHNFRPGIHDSNGLALHTGTGEWIWRPLNNPSMVALSSFAMENPKGFGLLQRGREFSRYEDLKDRYDLRPSAWIEPTNDWGKGHVRLVEIPTLDETNDNIVAFWAPDTLPAPGQPLQFDYRIRFTRDEPAILEGGLSYVWQTMHATGEVYQSNLVRAYDGTLAFLVDFTGPSLGDLAPEAPVVARVSANDNVEIVGSELQPNPAIKGRRLTFRIKVKDATKASELRAALELAGRTLTETWSLQIPPSPAARPAREGQASLNLFKASE
ncbi:glucans biosynthesis protein G [Aliidongia dinghuensis]|uniref:Glucans biosynthesis protein G n=1 Tax=Aliidongia dinghuensis TaxID=1867774 RepID=A0A8J2YPA9_9PROT|nr:glucans biosynthesis protein G [Aliidongia dinghuensis]